MSVLIRRRGQAWVAPPTSTFKVEAELEGLLAEEPGLLPGVDGPAVVVRQLQVPLVGPADLMAITADGDLLLVECKLRVNPEIRRAVIGQVFAYAAGLWRLGYEEFDQAFAARSGRRLHEALSAVAEQPVNSLQLRDAVTHNLATGRFGLIIAVDTITAELRRTVEYLNHHLMQDTSIVAMELMHSRDGDVEILLPSVYGQESAPAGSPSSPTRRWDQDSFTAELVKQVSEAGAAAVERLIEHVKATEGGTLYWGKGNTPNVTGWYPSGTTSVGLWSCYLYPGAARITVNVQFAVKSGVPADVPERLVQSLRRIAALAPQLERLEATGYRGWALLPIDDLLADSDNLHILVDTLDAVVGDRPPADESSSLL